MALLPFSVEDCKTPEGTERVFQQFRTVIDDLSAKLDKQTAARLSPGDLSAAEVAQLSKRIRDELQSPGAAPLNLQDLQGTPTGSGSSIFGGLQVTFVIGTLSPDTKPFLTILNAYQVIFYSTDFDHMYWWTGAAWKVIERTVGQICWFKTAPATAGWQLCNGSATTESTSAGATAAVTVPDLVTGNPYVRGGNAYSGPISTAAVAPTISGSTGIESVKHAHNLTPLGSLSGSVTATLPNHVHDVDSGYDGSGPTFISDAKSIVLGTVGDPWYWNGTMSGNTGDTDVDHRHYNTALCVVTTGPTDTVSVDDFFGGTDVASPTHIHNGTASGFTDYVSGGLSHHHDGGSLSVDATTFGHFHRLSGTTNGVNGLPVSISVTNTMSFSGSLTTTGTDSVDHTHPGSSLTVSTTGEPLHMTLLPYYRL